MTLKFNRLGISISQIVITVIMMMALLSSCSQATPKPEATPTPAIATTLRWGARNASTGIKARLGGGAGYALTISPDGKMLGIAGALGIATYDFNTLERLWISPLEFWKAVPFFGVDVAWSPDGDQLAVTSNGEISLWDAKTGKQLRKVQVENDYMTSVEWSPDGTMLATRAGSRNNNPRIILWNTQTWMQVLTMEVSNATFSFDWLAQGNFLVAVNDTEIALLDIRTRKETRTPLKIDLYFSMGSARWSHDGKRLVASGGDGKMVLWDARSWKQLPIVYEIPNDRSVVKTAWSPDDRLVAASIQNINHSIMVWDANTGEELRTFQRKQTGNTDEVRSLVWTPDGKHLVSLSQYEAITVWDVETGQEIRSLGDHTGWITSLAWSPAGDVLASGSEDGEIILWNPETGTKLRSFRDPNGWVYSLAWSPDGERLAEGGENAITIWQVQTGEQIKVLSGQGHGVKDIGWSPDGKLLASVSGDGQGIIWDGTTYSRLRFLEKGVMAMTFNLAWSPQGDLLATDYWPLSSSGEIVGVWDPQTGKLISSKQNVEKLISLPESDIVVSTIFPQSRRAGLVFWNIRTGEEIRKLKVDFILFGTDSSPNGKFLLLAGQLSVFVVDAQTGEELHVLNGHADSITEAVWSPRGDLVAASSHDGTVIVWGVNTP